jgi:hypothetical protein
VHLLVHPSKRPERMPALLQALKEPVAHQVIRHIKCGGMCFAVQEKACSNWPFGTPLIFARPTQLDVLPGRATQNWHAGLEFWQCHPAVQIVGTQHAGPGRQT